MPLHFGTAKIRKITETSKFSFSTKLPLSAAGQLFVCLFFLVAGTSFGTEKQSHEKAEDERRYHGIYKAHKGEIFWCGHYLYLFHGIVVSGFGGRVLGKLALGETLCEFGVGVCAVEPEIKSVKNGGNAAESHGEQKYLLESYFLFGQSGAVEQGEDHKADGKHHVVGPGDWGGYGVEKEVARNYRQN